MPRVTKVERAAKDYPESGIAKGDTYYHWKFRYGGLRRSKTYPKPSQLTQSDFLGQVYDLADRLSGLSVDMGVEEIKSEVEAIIEEIRALGEEQASKRDNMPYQLQDSGSGETLQNRADACEEWASNLEGIDLDFDDTDEALRGEIDTEGKTEEEIDAEVEEDRQSKIQELIDEISQYSSYDGE